MFHQTWVQILLCGLLDCLTKSTHEFVFKNHKGSKNDIIPGACNSHHPGNQHYAILVDHNKEAFVLTDDKSKDEVLEKIKKEIRKMKIPGRS